MQHLNLGQKVLHGGLAARWIWSLWGVGDIGRPLPERLGRKVDLEAT
jgi:hypothetical protein